MKTKQIYDSACSTAESLLGLDSVLSVQEVVVEPPPETFLMMFPGHDGLAHHEAVDELLKTVSEEVVLCDGDVLLQVENGVAHPRREVERVSWSLEELNH